MSRWSKLASLSILSGLLWGDARLAHAEQPYERSEDATPACDRLSFVQSGGFVGIHDQIDVELATKRIYVHHDGDAATRKAKLTDEEVLSILKAIVAADLPNAGGPYVCEHCADQFLYDVTFLTYQVHWEDGTDAPDALFALGELLQDVAERHFRR